MRIGLKTKHLLVRGECNLSLIDLRAATSNTNLDLLKTLPRKIVDLWTLNLA